MKKQDPTMLFIIVCLMLGLTTGASFMAMLISAVQKHQERQAVCEQLDDWGDRKFTYCKERK